MRTINSTNYMNYKVHQIVRSFADDIRDVIASGIPMDMSAFEIMHVEEGCYSCLGGTACINMGFGIDTLKSSVRSGQIAGMGDAIRMFAVERFAECVYDFRGKKTPTKPQIHGAFIWDRETIGFKPQVFAGIVRAEKEFELLIAQINFFADSLKKLDI